MKSSSPTTGSADRTQEICRTYAASDQRIRYFRHEINRGAAWNYNNTFFQAAGRFFRWAAHDDLSGATYLEACVPVMEENPDIVLCYPQTTIIDEHGAPIRTHDDSLTLMHEYPHQRIAAFDPGLCYPVFGLMRTDALAKTRLIDSYVGSDMPLLWHLALLGKTYEVPERLFQRRYHPQSSVRSNPDYKSRGQVV